MTHSLPPEHYFKRLIEDRVQFSYELHLNFSFINIITAGFIFGIYDGSLSVAMLLSWVFALVVIVLLEMLLYAAYLFHRQQYAPVMWEWSHLILSALECFIVGIGIWMVQSSSLPQANLPITIVILVYAVVLYGMYLFDVRAFAICVGCLFLPSVLYYAMLQTAQAVLFVMVFIVVGVMLISCAFISAQFFRLSTFNHYRIEELSKTLAAEKEISEIAFELAHSANQAKSLLFAAANHDLRQPLHAIGLLVEALKLEKKLPHDAKIIAEQMDGSVQTLNHMFNHFLDIQKIDSGELPVSLQTFELQLLFSEMVQRYGLLAAEKGLQLRMGVTDVLVHTDRALLGRILGNLISNAITYTEPGGVVWIGYRRSRQAIEIRDSGIGIAPEYHQSIFNDFYQVDHSHKPSASPVKNYGLGLSIVRRLAHILQLPLTLNSALGRGSVFRLGIQNVADASVGATSDKRAAKWPKEVDAAQVFRLKNVRVLLVESETEARHQVAEMLTRWSMDVRTALTSSSALSLMSPAFSEAQDSSLSETIKGDEWRPDLIISDYRLGQQTWVELGLSSQKKEKTADPQLWRIEKWHCPIIFLVNENTFFSSPSCVEHSKILHKPIDAEQLFSAMLELLATSKAGLHA